MWYKWLTFFFLTFSLILVLLGLHAGGLTIVVLSCIYYKLSLIVEMMKEDRNRSIKNKE